LLKVKQNLEAGRPYAMAFVDVRMPPGWDGIETSARLWEVTPGLQVVICTAYMDYSWEEMVEKLGYTDRLVILKKPFEAVEVLQLACALTEKWRLHQEAKGQLERLERLVRERTGVLENTNAELAQALANIQTLSGLIPICAGCKKVRDDRGFWDQVESYIARHSDAKFTHGICPECSLKYYPGIEYPKLPAK
jgi:DNA-binding LytR/AlgR family response regulator